MKILIGLFGLCAAVAVVMVVHAVHQEVVLRKLRDRMADNSVKVKTKETSIVTLKEKIASLKKTLDSSNSKVEELKKKKGEMENSRTEFEAVLKKCTDEKEAAVKKKTETAEAIIALKDSHKEVEKKNMEEIQSLKQHIGDRDKAICTFADTTQEEARKLCGITESTN